MYRLLVADDEIIERKVLLKTLQKNLEGQCELFQAENGREALEIYEKEKIQIAILDIEMPGINGIQAAEKIREKDKNCCIIFLTAYDEFSYAKKAITVRALDYILKPWDEKELMLVLEEAMRLAGEKEEQTRIRKVAEQAEAGQQIMEEEPDYANEICASAK
jgi:Response regulator containing CheY-like receiver domain and AraC-type DNA-binding domain